MSDTSQIDRRQADRTTRRVTAGSAGLSAILLVFVLNSLMGLGNDLRAQVARIAELSAQVTDLAHSSHDQGQRLVQLAESMRATRSELEAQVRNTALEERSLRRDLTELQRDVTGPNGWSKTQQDAYDRALREWVLGLCRDMRRRYDTLVPRDQEDLAATARAILDLDPSDPRLWTDDHKPRVDEIQRRAGIPVTSSQRDHVWALIQVARSLDATP